MKYIGDKSLSSLLGRLLLWFRFIMLALMIIGIPLELIALFQLFPRVEWVNRWIDFMMIVRPGPDQALAVKILICLQTAVVAPVILLLIEKPERLFRHF